MSRFLDKHDIVTQLFINHEIFHNCLVIKHPILSMHEEELHNNPRGITSVL